MRLFSASDDEFSATSPRHPTSTEPYTHTHDSHIKNHTSLIPLQGESVALALLAARLTAVRTESTDAWLDVLASSVLQWLTAQPNTLAPCIAGAWAAIYHPASAIGWQNLALACAGYTESSSSSAALRSQLRSPSISASIESQTPALTPDAPTTTCFSPPSSKTRSPSSDRSHQLRTALKLGHLARICTLVPGTVGHWILLLQIDLHASDDAASPPHNLAARVNELAQILPTAYHGALSATLARRRLLMQLPPHMQSLVPLLLSNKTEREIANHVNRSVHAIHDNVKAIYRVLKVSSRLELATKLYMEATPST